MKKLLLLCTVVFATLSLGSCGISSMTSNNLSETKVVLAEKNFKVVGKAYGSASATYIVGIGGLSRKALRNNAIDEMSNNAKLSGAQTLTNITTYTSIKMITPFYVKATCSATANIIEFE